MPGKSSYGRPTENDFSDYLNDLLGQQYNVTHMARLDARGEVDPTTSYYHITQTKSGKVMSTNLKIDMSFPSNVMTTYGGRYKQPVREFAPEILTRRGNYGYTVASQWEGEYRDVDNAAAGQPDYDVLHTLRSPTQGLARLITSGFEDTRRSQDLGDKNADVQTAIMNKLAEGSREDEDFTIPTGALLFGPSDSPANRRRAAESIQLTNVYTESGNQFTQRQRILESRVRQVEGQVPLRQEGGTTPVANFLKVGGYGPDRDNQARWVSYMQGAANVMGDTLVALPTEKVAKHRTLLDVSRQGANLYDPQGDPIQATRIPYRGSTSGFRQTTASVSGRVPEESLVLGTMFSSQYAVPGAGMYFPETTGVDVGSVGSTKQPNFSLTNDIASLLSGETQIKLGQEVGAEMKSGLKWTYARVKTPQSEDYIDLSERMGAHSFRLESQQLRIPRYYNPVSGLGEEADPSRRLMEVTPKQLVDLSTKVGVPVVMDETARGVSLEMTGQSQVNAKIGISGVKSALVEYAGTPSVSVQIPGGAQRELPISNLTWEAKSMPETMVTALGALPRRAQTGLLSSYARRLRSAEGSDIEVEQFQQMAAGVQVALQEVEQQRQADPNARLDVNRMAQLMGDVPIHQVGRDIFERVILGGQTSEQFAGKSERQLEQFAQSPTNIANLSRYGMGYVSPDMTTPVTTTWDESQVELQREAYVSAELGDSAQFYKSQGFGDLIDGKRQQTIRPSGLYMPVVSQPSVEYAGGGVLGAEQLALVNRVSPTFANRLGVGLQDITKAGSLARLENITNPSRKALAQLAYIASTEASRGTEVIQNPDAMTITGQMAGQMLADPKMQTLLGRKGGTLAGLEEFKDLYASYFPDVDRDKLLGRMVQSELAPGRYLPSPQSIGFLAEEDVPTMTDAERTGEDKTRLWNMMQGAFRGLLEGTHYGDAGAVMSGTARLTNYISESMGMPGGLKRESVKKIFGSDVGVTTARYTFDSELKQNEIFAPKELMETAIRQELSKQGIDPTDAEVAETYKMISGQASTVGPQTEYVTQHGVPGVALRYPIVAGEESIAGVNFVTREMLERQGREVPEVGAMTNLQYRMGLGLAGVFQGDFDLDQLMALMGLEGKRDKEGQLSVGIRGMRGGEIEPDLAANIERWGKVSYSEMQNRLFPSPAMAKEFDPVLQTFLERGEGGMRGVAGMVSGQMEKAKYYPYKELINNLLNYSGAKLQMGTTYNFTRMLESAQETAGWETSDIMTGRRARAPLYQPFLDFSSGVPHPLVSMFQTSVLSESTTGALGMTWGIPPTELGEKPEWLRQGARAGELTATNAFDMLQRMAGTAMVPFERKGQTTLTDPFTLAAAFSPEGERAFGRMPDETDLTKMSLEEALSRPWENQDLNMTQRSRGMQGALLDWTRANYQGREEKIFQAPLIQSMFTKSYTSKLRNEPDWELPSAFGPTPIGQQLVKGARLQQPVASMMMGKLSRADEYNFLMRNLQERQGQVGELSNFVLGNIQNTLGFGKTRLGSELNTLYEQTMSSPVLLRGSNLSGVIGQGPYYNTETTVGPKSRDEKEAQSLRMAGAYQLARQFGIPGSETFDFTSSLFPISERGREAIEAGRATETRLGEVMEGQDWYSTRGGTADESGRYQGAFVWRGDVAGQAAEVAATPDFLKLYQDEDTGEYRLQAVEQKTPSEGKDFSEDLEGWNTQAKLTPWIVNKLRGEIQAGGERGAIAEESLRATLGSYIPGAEKQEQAYEAVMARGMESQVLVTQRGSGVYEDILAGGDAAQRRIEAELAANVNKTLYQPSPTGRDDVMDEMTGFVEKGVQRIAESRPKAYSELWGMIQAGPAYWKERIRNLGAASKPTAQAKASADMLQQVRVQARAIGRGAEADLRAARGPGAPPPTASMQSMGDYFEAQAGPRMRSFMFSRMQNPAAVQVTQDKFDEQYVEMMEGITESARTGERMQVESYAGFDPTLFGAAVAETATKMGFQADVNVPADLSGVDIGFTPIPTTSTAPGAGGFVPSTPSAGAVSFDQDPEWMRLNAEYQDLASRRARSADADSPIALQMDSLQEQMTGREQEIAQGVQQPTRKPASQKNLSYMPTTIRRTGWKVVQGGGSEPVYETVDAQGNVVRPFPERDFTSPPGNIPPAGTPPTGTVPPTGTPISGAPPPGATPPTSMGGPYNQDLTAVAQEVMKTLLNRSGELMGAAGQMRGQLGVGPLGVGVGLGMLTPEVIQEEYGKYAEAGQVASKLSVNLKKLLKSGAQDQVAPHVWEAAGLSETEFGQLIREAGEIDVTGTGLGADVADLMSLFEKGITGDKPGKAGKPEMEIDTALDHFDRLGDISKRLTRNFEDLTSGTKDYSKYLEDAAALTAEQKFELARFKVSEAAAPLTKAGLMQEVAPGYYQKTVGPQPAGLEDRFAAEQQAYDAAMQTQQGAYADMTQVGVQKDKGLGGLMRRMFGGFGMMYMRSIANFATQGLDIGAQERIEMEGAFAQSTNLLAGGAVIQPRNQAQRIASQRALVGSEFQGVPAIMNYMQTTPGLSDAYSAGSAGLGAFAFASWAGGMMGPKSWLTKAAGPIGMAVSGASILASAAQQRQDPMGLAYRMSRTSPAGWMAQPASLFAAATLPDDQQEQLAIDINTQRMLRTNLGMKGLTWDEIGRPQSDLAKSKPSDWFRDPDTVEGMGAIAVGTQKELLAKYPQYAPEAIGAAYTFMQQTGVAPDQMEATLANMTLTGYTPGMASQMLQGFGVGMGEQYGGGRLAQMWTSTMGTVPAAQMPSYQAGLEALPDLGAGGYFMGTGMSDQQMMQFTTNIGGIAGTPGGDQYIRDVQQWQQQAQFGWQNIPSAADMASRMPSPGTPITQTEMGLDALRNAQIEGRDDQVAQLGELYARYLDYTPEEALALQGEMEGKTEGEVQYLYQQGEQVAKMGAMQRYLAPGRGAAYYTDYMRQMEAMEPGERGIQEDVQNQLSSVVQALRQQGMPSSFLDQLAPYMQETRTPEEIARYADKATWGMETAQQYRSVWGISDDQRLQATKDFEQMARTKTLSMFDQGIFEGAGKMDPYSLTQAVAYDMDIPGLGKIPAWMSTKDIWGPQGGPMEGMPIPVPQFTVSGASNVNFQYLEQMLPGAFDSGAGQAFAQGFQMPGTNLPAMAGTIGMGMYTRNLQTNAAAASAGIALKQNALQMEYLPKIWGVQDQLRDLGYEQTQWGFSRQLSGLQMQQGQFNQNMAFQQQQAQMQRGWARQDWAYQDTQRSQQWGWRVEDFEENVRFMTGRDRRLAERQMERETIVHGQEGDQIDRQRERQQEMWDMEDQRFDMQRAHFMENQEFQEEGIRKQREFYEERFELEKKLTDLQRELQMKQLELSRQQAAVQAQVAEEMKKANEIQTAISILMLAQQTGWEYIQKLGIQFADDFSQNLIDWINAAGGDPPAPPEDPKYHPDHIPDDPKDEDPPKDPDDFPEDPKDKWRPDQVPQGAGANTPWENEIIPAAAGAGDKRIIYLTLNLANKHFKDFVIDAVDQELNA